MRRARFFLRREGGAAAVEFALIGMLLILVSIGTIEIGRALFIFNELAHAADRAARAILIDPDISGSDLEAKVRDEDLLTGLTPGLVNVTPGIVEDNGITFRTVRLTYQFTPMVTGLTIGSFTMTTDRRVPE